MNKAARCILVAGCVAAFCAVAAGAFAAHALKHRLPLDQLAIWQTANTYHFYHSLGLILLGLGARDRQEKALMWAGGLMLAGIVLFSGSLYLLAWTGVSGLAAFAPLGGLCWLIAWLSFAAGMWRAPR